MVRSCLYSIANNQESPTDAITGPLVVSTFLFVAVLANFAIRGMCRSCHLSLFYSDHISDRPVHELSVFLFSLSHLLIILFSITHSRQHKVPIPGLALLQQIMPNFIPSAESY